MGAHATAADRHGDFTATPRIVFITVLAIAIGAASAVAAAALLKLIAFFTNLFFFQRLSVAEVSPAHHQIGAWAILVPVVGALVIGVMARFGSERIRGHGIPEAIESILLGGSRVEPRLAVLKPTSAAISIGSGGPFGAEGPIIMTGGAVGSLLAQLFHLTSAERKTLLVAGAAGGMSATFGAPLAATLLAVELLLFELKPRSLVPVAVASGCAAALRWHLIGPTPLFETARHPAFVGLSGLGGCLLVGLACGALSSLLTRAVYAAEDAFQRLPVHWMWWPAMGAVFVGVGGYFYPRALGVGYEVLGDLVHAPLPLRELCLIIAVKAAIWCIALGSGTSGGVLAPLLMLGGALGGLAALILPSFGGGFWPLIGMGAILGGTMRSPLTGALFAIEITQDFRMALPLMVASVAAHGFTVLVLKRSILTEKIARRGFHVSREYAIDPLEVLFVREVMRSDVVALPSDLPASFAADALTAAATRPQRLYPVIDGAEKLVGVLTRADLERLRTEADSKPLGDVTKGSPVVADEGDTLRLAVHRMADTQRLTLPVLTDDRRVIGLLSLADVLTARARHLEEERRRQRWITPGLPAALMVPFTRVFDIGRGPAPRDEDASP